MTPAFTFFWESGSPFSNWYPNSFDHLGVRYNCSEQYMMQQKALLFKDYDVAEMIMQQTSPHKQKFLGRQVRGFVYEEWMAVCNGIMVPALVSKFMQDTYSLNVMLDTGDSIIVEASPYDKVWGIGMKMDDPRAIDPSKWEGENRLGTILMEARDVIRQGI